jgi:hypothetical protein
MRACESYSWSRTTSCPSIRSHTAATRGVAGGAEHVSGRAPTKTTVQGRLWTTPGVPDALRPPPGWATGERGGGQVTNSRSHTEASPWLRPEPEPAAALGWLHTAASPWLRPESLDHPCRPRRAPAAPRGGGQVTNSRSHTAASPWLRPEADQSAALSGPAEREETRASSNAESTGRK